MGEVGECETKKANDRIREIGVNQSMIDVYSNFLEGLRTQCTTSSELTQQQIREFESKLVQLFGNNLLAAKLEANNDSKYNLNNTPFLRQWLIVVGLSSHSIQTICNTVSSIESLKCKTDTELELLLDTSRHEEIRRLCRAMHQLRRYMECPLSGNDYYWESWDRASPRPSVHDVHAQIHGTPTRSWPLANVPVTSQNGELTKSKSNESQIESTQDLSDSSITSVFKVEPSSPLTNNVEQNHNDAGSTNKVTDGVPWIPNSGMDLNIRHNITHKFTKSFQMISTCDYCKKQILFDAGLKCKECKYKCHKECVKGVPSSCGLTTQMLQETKVIIGSSWHHTKGKDKAHTDSASDTSNHSSAPPSPARIITTHKKEKFDFSDEATSSKGSTVTLTQERTASVKSDSSRTASVSGSASTDSARADSLDDPSDQTAWQKRQSSLSMKEWVIPYDQLKIIERLGSGRFGTVHRGMWHGDVAVKLLNVNHDNAALHAFKQEVATFRKTRHENLVLFMGACMKPPKLAIVTSLCKGNTLYTLIHVMKDKFNANKSAIVGQQISQGMDYLHSRGIIHKDLKTKNIFLENNKVVITDFGLFSVTKLCSANNGQTDGLGIPPGWLCYLAPELIRSLRVPRVTQQHELPFSTHTDIYAFGTVWYELLSGEWPFKSQPPESVIWQVGKGMKQSLTNLQASRDYKDILMFCWAYRPTERPTFAQLLQTLPKLPRKRLARSPSHPLHLSRSAESVF